MSAAAKAQKAAERRSKKVSQPAEVPASDAAPAPPAAIASSVDAAGVKLGHYMVSHCTFSDEAGLDVVGVCVSLATGAREVVDGYARWPCRTLSPQYLCTSKACVGARWKASSAVCVDDHVWEYSLVTTFPKLARGWLPQWVRDLIRDQDFYDEMS
jgi:hypothetical protein